MRFIVGLLLSVLGLPLSRILHAACMMLAYPHTQPTERSTAMLGAVIRERLKNGLRLDPTILDLDEVELREARMVDGEVIE